MLLCINSKPWSSNCSIRNAHHSTQLLLSHFFLYSQLSNFITKCHKYTSFYFCMVCIFKIIVKSYHYISTKRTQNRVLFVLFNWFIHRKIIVAPCHPGQSHYCHYFSVCMCLLLTKFKCHIIHIIIFWKKICFAIYKIV